MNQDSHKIRLRFAPSPTGFLHIGNLQSCLFDYLTAKKLGGKLILRIEDTDQKREVAGAAEGLIDILDWIGIKFDEGPGIGGEYGPYIQTERLAIYQKYLQELIDKGEAYPCFCTEERLAKMREEQQAMKKPPHYDRLCRNLSTEEAKARMAAGEKYVVRQKMPLSGEIIVHEELRGDLKFLAEDLDDHVLMKSNGIPTYQFASVVDDHLMEISHVLRGSDWLPSFPKNILLYRSFGWDNPKFFHLPLIMNKEGGKLSKRQGDVAVEDFRAKGYLPEGLLNFMVLMGWSPYAKASTFAKATEDKSGDAASGTSNPEILTLAEMEQKFDCYKLGTSPAIFDLDKLDYFNGYYIRQLQPIELTRLCRPYLSENIALTTNASKKTDEFVGKVIALERERMKKLSDIADFTKFFFVDNLVYDKELLVWRKSTPAGAKTALEDLLKVLDSISEDNWQTKKLEEIVVKYIKDNNKGVGDYLWPMRVALTGEKASPSPFEMADVLGKKETLDKINKAIAKLT